MACKDGQGTRRDPAQMVQPDDGKPGRPGRHDDHGAGQADGRIPWRDRLCRQLHRVVRRRGQAHLWRDRAPAYGRPPHHCAQGADWCGRGDHALELPQRHDHPQGRACSGRGLHRGLQARDRNAVFCVRAGRTGRTCRCAQGRAQHPDRQVLGNRYGNHRQPDRAQDHVHRLDRDRQDADGTVGRDREEGHHGTGRQRTVHGL